MPKIKSGFMNHVNADYSTMGIYIKKGEIKIMEKTIESEIQEIINKYDLSYSDIDSLNEDYDFNYEDEDDCNCEFCTCQNETIEEEFAKYEYEQFQKTKISTPQHGL